MLGLREKRVNMKLTRKSLGERLKLSERTIYQYETGRREPNLETLKKMAQFFNCTIEDLL